MTYVCISYIDDVNFSDTVVLSACTDQFRCEIMRPVNVTYDLKLAYFNIHTYMYTQSHTAYTGI